MITLLRLHCEVMNNCQMMFQILFDTLKVFKLLNMCSKMQVYGTPLLKKVEVQACGEQYYLHSNEHVYTHTHKHTGTELLPSQIAIENEVKMV